MSTHNNVKVKDVMLKLESFPVVKENTMFKETLEAMAPSDLGIACIVNDSNNLLGIVTDGDIRRKLLRVQKPFSAFFSDDAIVHSVRNPITITEGDSLNHAVQIMGEKKIWDLPVIDSNNHLVGLLHLHPAIEKLING